MLFVHLIQSKEGSRRDAIPPTPFFILFLNYIAK